MDIEQLIYEISNECTLSPTDIIAVLTALGGKLKAHLEDGKIVNLENIGRFKIGFTSNAQSAPELLKPEDISKFHINYQPTVKLKRWLKKGLVVVREWKG